MTTTANPAATRTPVLPKDVKVADLPEAVLKGLKAAHDKDRGLKGADIARVLVATGHLAAKGNPGLRLRTYMRAHGAYVGQGRTYGLTVAQASRIAVGFINGVAPTKAYRKGIEVTEANTAA